MDVQGGCLCGAVRYRSSAAPITARICWCRLCQYLSTGNGSVNVGFARDAVTIEGAVSDYRSVADSGNVMHRHFCPACGTHLFSEAEARPHLIFVRAGSLDDPNIVAPEMTIWTAQAPRYACIGNDLPTFAGQPPPAA